MLRVIRHLHIDVSNDCLRRLWLGRVRILRTFGTLRALRARKRLGRRECSRDGNGHWDVVLNNLRWCCGNVVWHVDHRRLRRRRGRSWLQPPDRPMLLGGQVEGRLAGLLYNRWDNLSWVDVRDVFVIGRDIAPTEVSLIDECDGRLVDFSREYLYVNFLLDLWKLLLDLDEWEVIELHSWLVSINKDIDSIDGVFMHFLHDSFSHYLVSSFLATNDFLNLLSHEFVVKKVFLLLLLLDNLFFALNFVIFGKSCVVSVLGIDSLVLDSESLSSMLRITLLLELLELLRAFSKRVHYLLTSFIGEEVD